MPHMKSFIIADKIGIKKFQNFIDDNFFPLRHHRHMFISYSTSHNSH